jgi:phosphopantetheinyl transferase
MTPGANEVSTGSHGDRLRTIEGELQRQCFVEGWRKRVGARRAPLTPDAPTDVVSVWIATVQQMAALADCEFILSSDDRAFINQHRAPSSRASTMAARILLRLALSAASDTPVGLAAWRTKTQETGKPELCGGFPRLQFSFTHTRSLVAVAVASHCSVGVDIECADQEIEPNVFDMFCCPAEVSSLHSAAASTMSREFVKLWTLKEAHSKLLGRGHAIDLRLLCGIPAADGADACDHRPEHVHRESVFVTQDMVLHHLSVAIELPARIQTAELVVMTPDVRLLCEADIELDTRGPATPHLLPSEN